MKISLNVFKLLRYFWIWQGRTLFIFLFFNLKLIEWSNKISKRCSSFRKSCSNRWPHYCLTNDQSCDFFIVQSIEKYDTRIVLHILSKITDKLSPLSTISDSYVELCKFSNNLIYQFLVKNNYNKGIFILDKYFYVRF